MGCDIHLKLEKRAVKPSFRRLTKYDDDGKVIGYDIKEYHPAFNEWEPVAITIRKCWNDNVYGMFAKLANVRNYFDNNIEPIPVRGFPDDACDNTKSAYCYFVCSDEEYENSRYYQDSSEWINDSRADQWVKDGLSIEMKFGNNNFRKISNPDYHSPNWCSTEEMRQCIHEIFFDEEKKVWHGDFIEWFGLLGAMEGIEREGFYECRAVFWFDN